jgi:hypothetical protein
VKAVERGLGGRGAEDSLDGVAVGGGGGGVDAGGGVARMASPAPWALQEAATTVYWRVKEAGTEVDEASWAVQGAATAPWAVEGAATAEDVLAATWGVLHGTPIRFSFFRATLHGLAAMLTKKKVAHEKSEMPILLNHWIEFILVPRKRYCKSRH